MSGHGGFSLKKRLIGGIAVANFLVLAVNTPWFLWRGYLHHNVEIESGREAMGDWLIHEVVTDVIPLTVPLLIANLLFVIWIVRSSLAPIKALSRHAAALDAAHLGERLSSQGVPREILPFVNAVNAALQHLEEGFESQKRFTANAAHELRTPLAVLKARCSGNVGTDMPVLASDIDRMARIVDQLLSIARLEMGQIPLEGAVELADVCRQTIADIYPFALQSGCDLAFDKDSDWKLRKGNDILLGDALRNLVENAIRHSPNGGVVEVQLAAPGVIRVTDCGPGVPDDLKNEIFLPFRRGKSQKGGGAGLGLSIATEVVNLHGGNLTLADRKGGGAVFTLDLSKVAVPSG